MESLIEKEELTKLMKIKGETRGLGMTNELDFLLEREGPVGLKRFEEKMEKLGYPVKYREIKAMDFFPLNKYAVAQVVMQRLFGFTDADFRAMGKYESKVSLIMKIFMKYFFSPEILIKQAVSIWKRYYTVGSLEVAEFNNDKKQVILRVKDFELHALNCRVLEGYLEGILQMVIGGKVICRETKCRYKGEEYDEFLLNW